FFFFFCGFFFFFFFFFFFQHTPEFRQEALKLAERIGVAATVRELNLYESQLYN
ncbi:Transposase insN for insertion sequence element IS911A, partial [Salmonella enterica subsp. enterica serovar Newport str. SHSN008]